MTITDRIDPVSEKSVQRGKCTFVEEYTVVVNGQEFGPFKHECVLGEKHDGQDHKCSFGKVIGKHKAEFGDRLGLGLFPTKESPKESFSF
jgi:hypothetical protein